MPALESHPLFTPWTDPTSGVTSYLLNDVFSSIQQHFYYTNPSISADGKWLWLTVAHPPGPSKSLAVVSLDPEQPNIQNIPGAQTDLATPGLSRDGESALFGTNGAIYLAKPSGEMRELGRLPATWLNGRGLIRL